MYLAPSDLADGKRTVCPYAKIAMCEEPCLNTAGRGGFIPSIQKARIRKTLLFLDEYETFMSYLIEDINKFIRECQRENKIPCVRLNGTSDIQWEHQEYKGKTVFEMFPSVQFYDYTDKIVRQYEEDDLVVSTREASKRRWGRPSRRVARMEPDCTVEWRGSWYDAKVLQAEKDRWFIHYVDDDDSWDEWVGKDRIRFKKVTADNK